MISEKVIQITVKCGRSEINTGAKEMSENVAFSQESNLGLQHYRSDALTTRPTEPTTHATG